MNDGTYSPIPMNEAGGQRPLPARRHRAHERRRRDRWLREWLQYGNRTPSSSSSAGYAVAGMRYRGEGTTLRPGAEGDVAPGRQLFNRGPLEYDMPLR